VEHLVEYAYHYGRMALPLIPRASIIPKPSSTTTNSTNGFVRNNGTASDETVHKGIPVILFLSHHGAARQTVIDAIVNAKGGPSPPVFVKWLGFRRKPCGVGIHHIETTFGPSIEDVDMGSTTNNIDDGYAKNQMFRKVDLVNTPDMGSEEVRGI
jgi:hypothetical protein